MADWQQRLAEVNRPGKSKVVIAHLHPGEVSTIFEESLVNTLNFDLAHDQRLYRPGQLGLLSIQAGSNLGIHETYDAAKLVQEAVHPEANIIFGAVVAGFGFAPVGQVGLSPVGHVEQVAQHLHLLALLALAQQGAHRHLQVLAQQVEQGRFDRGDSVDRGAQVEGLLAAAAGVAVGEAGAHLVEDGLQVADGAALDQRTRILQRLADLLAAGHLAQAGVARVVGDDDDVASEKGRMRAREVQQHAVPPRDGDDTHLLDDGRGHGDRVGDRGPGLSRP